MNYQGERSLRRIGYWFTVLTDKFCPFVESDNHGEEGCLEQIARLCSGLHWNEIYFVAYHLRAGGNSQTHGEAVTN